MTQIDQRALARAREVLAGIQEDEQLREAMAKMPPTKKKTRAGFMNTPPNVEPLRRAADEAVQELREALAAATDAADHNAKLDRGTQVDSARFPALRRGES